MIIRIWDDEERREYSRKIEEISEELIKISSVNLSPRERFKILTMPRYWDLIVGDAPLDEVFREINKRLRRLQRLYGNKKIFHA